MSHSFFLVLFIVLVYPFLCVSIFSWLFSLLLIHSSSHPVFSLKYNFPYSFCLVFPFPPSPSFLHILSFRLAPLPSCLPSPFWFFPPVLHLFLFTSTLPKFPSSYKASSLTTFLILSRSSSSCTYLFSPPVLRSRLLKLFSLNPSNYMCSPFHLSHMFFSTIWKRTNSAVPNSYK